MKIGAGQQHMGADLVLNAGFPAAILLRDFTEA